MERFLKNVGHSETAPKLNAPGFSGLSRLSKSVQKSVQKTVLRGQHNCLKSYCLRFLKNDINKYVCSPTLCIQPHSFDNCYLVKSEAKNFSFWMLTLTLSIFNICLKIFIRNQTLLDHKNKTIVTQQVNFAQIFRTPVSALQFPVYQKYCFKY